MCTRRSLTCTVCRTEQYSARGRLIVPLSTMYARQFTQVLSSPHHTVHGLPQYTFKGKNTAVFLAVQLYNGSLG